MYKRYCCALNEDVFMVRDCTYTSISLTFSLFEWVSSKTHWLGYSVLDNRGIVVPLLARVRGFFVTQVSRNALGPAQLLFPDGKAAED